MNTFRKGLSFYTLTTKSLVLSFYKKIGPRSHCSHIAESETP